MKPLNVAISMAILAMPLCAAAQDKPNTTTTVLSQPTAAQNQDSPLVRAAKASGRLNKKATTVITNENLVRTGGHFTTTSAQNPLPPPAPKLDNTVPAQAEAAARAKADADAKAKKEAAKKQQQLRNAAADYYGESIEPRVDDPAAQEHVMNQMTSTQPKTVTPAKPPQN